VNEIQDVTSSSYCVHIIAIIKFMYSVCGCDKTVGCCVLYSHTQTLCQRQAQSRAISTAYNVQFTTILLCTNGNRLYHITVRCRVCSLYSQQSSVLTIMLLVPVSRCVVAFPVAFYFCVFGLSYSMFFLTADWLSVA
jgi:hypothetical protein